jgi:long-chain acyl-CoA synthetase
MVEQMPTRVLLSGANGFLGTQIARQLINLPGIEILAMVRSKNREHGLTRLKRAWSDWDELQMH